jgi:5-methylcytosine-specific restriction protein A
MTRRNFTKAVMVARIKASTVDGKIFCNACGALCKKFEIDHILADGMHTDEDKDKSNSFENSRLLCIPCHAEKTKKDVANIARAKRVEFKHLGGKMSKKTIQSRGFPKKEHKEKLPLPPRKNLFEG